MKNIVGGLADKNEDHVESDHHDGKHSERIYCELNNFQQYSNFTIKKKNDMMTNPKVKLKSEQIMNESKGNIKRKS